MQKIIFAVLLLAIPTIIHGEDAEGDSTHKYVTQEIAGQDARDKLLDQLFTNYKTYSYPQNTTINFGVTLLDSRLDQTHDTMNLDVWLRYSWEDSRLAWNKEELGITVLRIPAAKVWLPDITLYNSADANQRLNCWDSNVLVYSTGIVLWVPPCHLSSYCNLTLSRHPFGEQVCTLKFGSWTFDGLTMGLDFWKNEKAVNTQYYMGSSNYQVTKNIAEKNEKKYDCCLEPYFDLTFTLGLTKKPEGCEHH